MAGASIYIYKSFMYHARWCLPKKFFFCHPDQSRIAYSVFEILGVALSDRIETF